MTNQRKTRQRQNILDCLKENYGKNLTPDEILFILKKQSKPIGLSTIYRQLNNLVEEGLVRRCNLEGQHCSYYQRVDEECLYDEHYHMICSSCSKLLHFQDENLKKALFKAENKNHFILNSQKIVFYGKCSKCLKKEKS